MNRINATAYICLLGLLGLPGCADTVDESTETTTWVVTPGPKGDHGGFEAPSDTSEPWQAPVEDAFLGEDSADGGESADGAGPSEPDADAIAPPPPPPPLEVPTLDEEPAAICAAAQASAWYFQFLDNLCDEKVLPSDQDQERACPVLDSSAEMELQDGSWVTYQPSTEPPTWDTWSLADLVPASMDISVILIKRVDGVPHYRYLSNGRHDVTFQPWSTTKVFAAANAGAKMRILSDGAVGLDATVGDHLVGDLVTSVVAYDNDPYASNALGAYFHDIGGRQRANDLIGPLWLQRPDHETFGGNYGDAVPNIGYDFVSPTGDPLSVTPDKSGGYANHLSTHTLAEAVKRIVLHREEPAQRLPGLEWEDVKVLLYGATGSSKGAWGGMSADTAIYLQAGHDMAYIEERSQGQWLTFSKLGLGSQGQFAQTGYACFPVLDEAGAPIPGHGREFVIATHLKEGGSTWAERDRELARIYRRIEIRIVDGRL